MRPADPSKEEPARFNRYRGPVPAPRIRWGEACRCGHGRSEHYEPFGCMRWDSRTAKGWCQCDGFAPACRLQ